MTVPGLTVALDNGTGAFPIDISQFVLASDGYDITRGRDDWQGAVTAGELTLTLNNSDGRFTPGSTIMGSPSPIKVDQRIRVTVSGAGFDALPFDSTGFDAGTLTRFTGYVKSWPVSWPAVVPTFATVTLTATDAQARAERRTLRSMLEEEVFLDSPLSYYTLAEPGGATTAGDTSGNGNSPLVMQGTGAPVAFGATGTNVDGLTVAQFTSGGQTLGGINTPVAPYAIELEVNTLGAAGGILQLAPGNNPTFSLDQLADGTLIFNFLPGTAALWQAVSVARGVNSNTFHVVLLVTSSTIQMYVNGVSVGTHTYSTLSPDNLALKLGIGTVAFGSPIGLTAPPPLAGQISNLAIYSAAPSAARIAQHANAALGVAEVSTARLSRLASYAGLTIGALDTALTTVPAQATSGSSAWDAIQEVTDAEMGLVYIDGSGNLAFHNRARMAGKTAPDLILDAQYVTPDVQPVTDDQRIVNYFEVTAAGTGGLSVARSATSETTHGRYPTSQTYLVQTDQEAVDRANWIVSKQAEPGARYGSLTINLYKMTADQAALAVDALDLDCWLRVTSLASQNPGGTVVDVMVQGWRETATGESWAIACNVVPRSLYTAFIVDDPVFGAVDSYPLMF